MKQGEIWLVDLNPTMGAEMKKIRPALIINANAFGKLPLKIIVPVTEWQNRYAAIPWMLQVKPDGANGLNKLSSIDCFQIRCVAQERLLKKMGNVTVDEVEQAIDKITKIIGFNYFNV
ncbi:MAG: type II toxin-antitoxin system PemK/MazF family toxin [Prevotellaceae bacterium]|jgi:mRNA interferase MazF|nr:type II toxin-antitoxin system PemK/MazF family toxin [Prevotellaceae bacterium]